MEAKSPLNSFQDLDTVEFYPIPILNGAFGRTRLGFRNPAGLNLEIIKLMILGHFHEF